MTKLSNIAFATCLLVPGLALAELAEGDAVGTTEEEVRATLENSGYVIGEIEVDGDEIEVEATLSGQAYEFEISSETGMVLEVELEDSEDDVEEDDDET